jgi:hypothetical protein
MAGGNRFMIKLGIVNGSELTPEAVAALNRHDAALVSSHESLVRCRRAGVAIPLHVQPHGREIATLHIGRGGCFSPRPQRASSQQPFTEGDVCMVTPGHRGDMLNILPVAKHLHDQGLRVWMSVPELCEDLFDERIPYVQLFRSPVNRCHMIEAMAAAKREFKQVVRCHLDTLESPKATSHWTTEMWWLAGFLPHFGDPAWRLDIARREKHPGQPKIVVNVTSAITAPFADGPRLLDELRRAFPGRILDIGSLRVSSLLDLLPIMDAALCVVSIDTGTLHLAGAASVPLIALVPREVGGDPWRSTLPRFYHSLIGYQEAALCPALVIAAIERATGISANACRLQAA